MRVTRPKSKGDPYALEHLRAAWGARILAQNELRAREADLRRRVKEARKSGASVRVIAEHSGLSTSTVQDWLKQD